MKNWTRKLKVFDKTWQGREFRLESDKNSKNSEKKFNKFGKMDKF